MKLETWLLLLLSLRLFRESSRKCFVCKAPFIQVNVSTPESFLFDDKKRHNPRVEFQQQEQTGISPGNTQQTKLQHTHPWEIGREREKAGREVFGLIRKCRLCTAMWGTAEMKGAFLIRVTFSYDRIPKLDRVKMFLIRLEWFCTEAWCVVQYELIHRVTTTLNST